jgi:hypothetical protein
MTRAGKIGMTTANSAFQFAVDNVDTFDVSTGAVLRLAEIPDFPPTTPSLPRLRNGSNARPSRLTTICSNRDWRFIPANFQNNFAAVPIAVAH